MDDFDLISSYTRAEAIADGVLVDVTKQASTDEMLGGFRVSVAVTAGLWHAIEAIPDSLVGCADVRGRLHDILWMASLAARADRDTFCVILPVKGIRKKVQVLTVHVGPDDLGQACVTIRVPGGLLSSATV